MASKEALTKVKTNLAGGIVGLANVGKSTFFQTLTNTTLGIPANYPFATIDPERSRAIVPSIRLKRLARVYEPKSQVPASLEVVDIAGLVRGAAQGNGLGNAFLSHIRSVDGLFQMVRAFDDADIVHVENSVDPVRDMRITHDELVLKDMEFTASAIDNLSKQLKKSPQGLDKRVALETAEAVMSILDGGKKVTTKQDWTAEQISHLRSLSLLTAKPSVYIVNVSEEDYCFGSEVPGIVDIREWVKQHSPGDAVLPLSVNFESRLSQLSEEERAQELSELGVKSALPFAILELRRALGLASFFTAGKDEVREWTIRVGSTAPQAAGAIHGDLEKTFITANVTSVEDIEALAGDTGALRKAAKISRKGKDYIVNDGDVIHFQSGKGKNN